jgi:hypothetical protein
MFCSLIAQENMKQTWEELHVLCLSAPKAAHFQIRCQVFFPFPAAAGKRLVFFQMILLFAVVAETFIIFIETC